MPNYEIVLKNWCTVWSCRCSFRRAKGDETPTAVCVSYTYDNKFIVYPKITDNLLYSAIRKGFFSLPQESLDAAASFSYETKHASIRFFDFHLTRSCEGRVRVPGSWQEYTARITEFPYNVNVWLLDYHKIPYGSSNEITKLLQAAFFERIKLPNCGETDPIAHIQLHSHVPVAAEAVAAEAVATEPPAKRADKFKPETTKYGRIKNAKSANLLCYRDSQQLKLDPSQAPQSILSLHTVSALELDVLSWINTLRYLTNSMLIDLVESGLISIDPEHLPKRKRLTKTLLNMRDSGLVKLSHFITANKDEKSVTHIFTLDKFGKTLLSELDRDFRYNPFELFQDGNIVKATLAANQWLVYWLSCYPEVFANSYEPSRILYLRNQERTGARLHATVTCGKTVLVGVPVRRAATDEAMADTLRDKMQRLLALFSAKPGEVFSRYSEIKFPSRPIICLICEDDEHALAVHRLLTGLLNKSPDQEVWYTTDLKMFNYNEEGKRFFSYTPDDEQSYLDLSQRLGLGQERTWLTSEEPESAPE